MEAGILKDYLDRKSREVINMLCAKYDYKMDIAVKQEEAYEDGLNAGIEKGLEQTATNLLKMHKLTNEQISQVTGLSVEKVLEIAELIK